MPMSSREIIQLLQANGFVFVSQNGSHKKFKNKETGKIAIVPDPVKTLKTGTEQNILKQAGLK